ncbi:hypothetical protein CBR_g55481 [Chara braunii]|uniref:Uncharacterized protein n=1 Tax=Chara braunii TaxID=69332 RepID=A0A388MD03_CHABU|nr:hypothetical protein CBR_g55481 [Chara braunii]|eukprot:GBG92444.1 hypothetical protein CBR_g55481 [Chara braunii]
MTTLPWLLLISATSRGDRSASALGASAGSDGFYMPFCSMRFYCGGLVITIREVNNMSGDHGDEDSTFGELEADAWLTTVQVDRVRVSQVVAKLRSAVAVTSVPSLSWILSERQRLLEITWGLEEGPPPHLCSFVDWPRLDDFMQQFYEVLEEEQDLCAALEDRCINLVAEDGINIVSANIDNLTAIVLIGAVNSNGKNNNDTGNNDNNNNNNSNNDYKNDNG